MRAGTWRPCGWRRRLGSSTRRGGRSTTSWTRLWQWPGGREVSGMVDAEDSTVSASPTAVDGPVGVVAVVGRPNVGKSTLVGRLSGRRGPIVGPVSGLTRDRLDVEASWQGTSFVLQD